MCAPPMRIWADTVNARLRSFPTRGNTVIGAAMGLPKSLHSLVIRALAALAAMLLLATAVVAQEATQAPASGVDEVDAAQVESLIELLQDDTRREAFVGDLEALIATQAEEPTDEPQDIGQRVTHRLSALVDRMSQRTVGSVNSLLDVRTLINQVRAIFAEPVVRDRWSEISLKLLLVLGPATIAFAVVGRLMRDTRQRMGSRRAKEVLSRLSTVLMRLVVDLLPVLAFAIVSYAILPLTEPLPFTRIVAISAINVTLMIQIVLLIARAVLVPRSPHLRLFTLADETAAYIYVWVRRLAYLGGYVFVVAGALQLLGFSEIGTVVSRTGALIIGLMLVLLILQNRSSVRRALRGDKATTHPVLSVFRRQLAEVWHILALLYLVSAFLVWSFRVPGGITYLARGTLLSLLVIIGARVLVVAVHHAVTRGFSVGGQLRERYPTLEQRANRYLPILRTVAITLIYGFAGLALLEAWQVRVSVWLTSGIGQRVASAVVTVAVVLIIAFILWELISSAIERYLDSTDDEGEVVQRTARERTLLPLLRNVLLVVIVVVVSLVILSEIGVNIAPLLAAAGVAGIAIGFGSQKLVQDVINGLFILFEDTISVGDVVEVAGHAGLVESISVRTLSLRDLEGHVHTVPFSEVATIRNMSKEFSYALMDVGIAYRENVAEVIEVLRQIGAELEADPGLGPLILEPIEILGLDQFGDSAIVIKARMKTLPIKQWAVKRAFNLRMKERFDALGIEIPFPHMTLYFGEDKSGHSPPAQIIVSERERKRSAQPVSEETELKVEDVPAPTDG